MTSLTLSAALIAIMVPAVGGSVDGVVPVSVSCPPPDRPLLSVAWREPAVPLVLSEDISSLTDFSNTHGGVLHEIDDRHTLGQYRAQAGYGIELTYRTLTFQGAGLACVSLDNVSVEVVLDPTIYIAREIPQYSCLYNEILIHEQKHHQVSKRAMAWLAEQLPLRVEAFLRRLPDPRPVSDAAIGQETERLKAMIAGQVDKLFQQVNTIRAEADAKVDSEEEYARIAASCPHQDRSFLVRENAQPPHRQDRRHRDHVSRVLTSPPAAYRDGFAPPLPVEAAPARPASRSQPVPPPYIPGQPARR